MFSEENIQSAIQKLKTVQYDGLQKTNEAIYDLITLGTALEQTIEGDSKSFTLNYIDWKNPANNAFHAVAEFSVERARSTETARPDIVLFVNGIPLVVIECKAPRYGCRASSIPNDPQPRRRIHPGAFSRTHKSYWP